MRFGRYSRLAWVNSISFCRAAAVAHTRMFSKVADMGVGSICVLAMCQLHVPKLWIRYCNWQVYFAGLVINCCPHEWKHTFYAARVLWTLKTVLGEQWLTCMRQVQPYQAKVILWPKVGLWGAELWHRRMKEVHVYCSDIYCGHAMMRDIIIRSTRKQTKGLSCLKCSCKVFSFKPRCYCAKVSVHTLAEPKTFPTKFWREKPKAMNMWVTPLCSITSCLEISIV